MIGRRTASAVALAAVTGVLLSGCGRSDDTDKPAAAATLTAGKATGTVTIWAQGTEGEALPKLVKGFEAANPGVTVKVTAVPWDSAEKKYRTAIAGGTGPDVGMFGTDWMSSFGNDLAPTPAQVDTSGFFPASVDTTKVGGTAYGVPWTVDTRVVFYRTDLLKKAGHSSFPTTWAGFEALARDLQSKAGARYGVGLPTSGFNSFLSILPFIWSNGGSVLSDDQKTWTFDSPQVVEAMKYLNGFFTSGLANKTPSTAAGSPESDFVSGRVPMMISGPWETASLVQAGGKDFADKFALAPLPAQKTSTSFLGGSDLVVMKKAKNADAAWKLIQWLSQPATQVEWFKLSGDLPSQQAAWKDPVLTSDSKVSVFGKQLLSVRTPPTLPTWNEVSAAGDGALEEMVKGGQSPEQAMKGLQGKAASIGTGGS
ncbi:sugar ABC transporter substrate-binding protein [Streptomyces sp. CA-111067]|uniref:sugar ABC transporter substrate-binding protein n=1 Tax=Streptomyces sp. CA-111067 TaxID=3240046 RepID=UPI003D96A5BE